VACAGGFDGLVQAGEGANVNHEAVTIRFSVAGLRRREVCFSAPDLIKETGK
jgi:hypothetical protein